MDDRNDLNDQQEPMPRPAWHRWAARIGLVLFIMLILMQIFNMVRGAY